MALKKPKLDKKAKSVVWYKRGIRELTKQEALKMRTKIKNIIKTLPKEVSLLLLAAGFVYAFRTVAESDPVLTGSGILLAMFLIATARK